MPVLPLALLLACAPSPAPEAPTPPSWPAEGAMEGFFPVEEISTAFMEAHGLPFSSVQVQAWLPRVGKLEIPVGEVVLEPGAMDAEESAWCGSALRRRFNPRRCRAYEEAECRAGGCRLQAWHSCSGLFLDSARFITAAHCTQGWSLDQQPAVRVLEASHTEAGWRVEPWAITGTVPLKRSWEEGWVIHTPASDDRMDVALLVVTPAEGGAGAMLLPTASPAALPDAGEPLWVLGFPRNTSRPAEAMARGGYGAVYGTPSVSFGRVLDPNPTGAFLCAVDGEQDHWRLLTDCPSAVAPGPDGAPVHTGVLTEGPFLADIDTMNGYSGAPLFDAEGRWVGLMDTVYGADPRAGWSPAMRVVGVQAIAALTALSALEPRASP